MHNKVWERIHWNVSSPKGLCVLVVGIRRTTTTLRIITETRTKKNKKNIKNKDNKDNKYYLRECYELFAALTLYLYAYINIWEFRSMIHFQGVLLSGENNNSRSIGSQRLKELEQERRHHQRQRGWYWLHQFRKQEQKNKKKLENKDNKNKNENNNAVITRTISRQ